MFVYYLSVIFVLVYSLLKYVYTYWDRNRLPNIKPQIPFGNLKDVALKKRSFGLAIYDLYNKSKEPFVGIYLFFRPAILVRDAHLAKQILTTDFSSFHDRGVYLNEEKDPFSADLFALPGERWKNLRQKLSPTFTSGKLRNMMPTILDVGKKLTDKADEIVEMGKQIEITELATCYSVDIIASVIFGVEVDTINNPENDFRNVAKDLRYNVWNSLRNAAVFICPKIIEILNVHSLPKKMRDFVFGLVKDTIEFREKKDYTRKDFMQLLIDLRKEDLDKNTKAITLQQIAAQVFLFYIAGQETSASIIAFTLHELTQQPELMVKIQQNIDDVLTKNNGEINYETIKEMKYLELCVLETMRKYSFPLLNRECTKDFKMPDSDFTVKKGTPIIISLSGITMDPAYFPEPEKYMPERFSEEHKNYDENAYYPFGIGPRYCIGVRLGRIMIKIGLILLLSKYNFGATQGPEVEFDTTGVGLLSKNGIYLKAAKRK